MHLNKGVQPAPEKEGSSLGSEGGKMGLIGKIWRMKCNASQAEKQLFRLFGGKR